jgi:RNA polymerase sigma-70 factor (ECF subfamily)
MLRTPRAIRIVSRPEIGRQMEEDRTLVEKAQQGDKTAFGELVRKHQRKVYAIALQMTGDHGEADDLAQEAFLRAFQALGSFDGRSEFPTWMYRIVVNLTINHIKRRGRNCAAEESDPRVVGAVAASVAQDDPAAALEQRRFYALLAKALDELPETLRTTVVLVSLQGLTHRVVAEILGCSEGTVSWRIHEARKQLRERLRGDLGSVRDGSSGGT